MTPLQAQIISAWEGLHPIFKVVPDKKHVPSPGDPWRYIIVQEDNDVTIGAITKTLHKARHQFNEAPLEQLWNSMVSGHLPKPKITPAKANSHMADLIKEDFPVEPREPREHKAPWPLTTLQSRILTGWEALHGEFGIVPDPDYVPARYAPWRYLIERLEDKAIVGAVTRYAQEAADPAHVAMVSQLRNALKYGHMPKEQAPGHERPRDPASGQLLPWKYKKHPSTTTDPAASHHLPAGYPPENSAYPPPIPNLGKPTVRTGKALDLWKYGTHKKWHSDFNKKRKLWI